MSELSNYLDEFSRQSRWNEKDDAELNALIVQYTSLREESMQSINNRAQILLLGVTAISALIGGSLTIQDPQSSRILIYSIFSGAIPLVFIFVLFVWAGEAMRAQRVGYFLTAEMEARINRKLGRFIMNWESALWSGILPRDEIFGPSMMSLAVLGFLATVSPWLGIILCGRQNIPSIQIILAVLIPYLFLALSALYIVANLKRLKNNPVVRSVFLRDVREHRNNQSQQRRHSRRSR